MFDTQEVLSEFHIQPVHGGACTGTGGWSATEGRKAFEAVNPADGTVTAS
jgi:aldehyde dehydrogenase (NAD+)